MQSTQVALQCWEFAKTNHIPNDWKASQAYFSNNVGITAHWQSNSFKLGDAWMDSHALICFFLYADAPLYEPLVVDKKKWEDFRLALMDYSWPVLPKSRTNVSGKDEGMTLVMWDLIFANAFEVRIETVKNHPFGSMYYSSSAAMMNDQYFALGQFYRDCAMGFRTDTKALHTKDYYQNKQFKRPYNSPMLEAYSELLAAENDCGILANLTPACTVGAILILNFRMRTVRAPVVTKTPWHRFFPSVKYASFEVLDGLGSQIKLRSGKTVAATQLLWDGLLASWQQLRIMIHGNNADDDDAFRIMMTSHDTLFGWRCDQLFLKGDMMAWQTTLKGHAVEFTQEDVLDLDYLDEYFETSLEKNMMLDSFKTSPVSFENPVLIFTWNADAAIKKFGNVEEALLSEIKHIYERKTFDLISQSLELMPWETVALFPMLANFEKWIPGKREIMLFLLDYRKRTFDPSDMTLSEEAKKTSASVPGAISRAITKYALIKDPTIKRPSGFPPDVDIFTTVNRLATATGLDISVMKFEKNNYAADGTIILKSKVQQDGEVKELKMPFGTFLALLVSSKEPDSKYVHHKGPMARFRTRLMSLLSDAKVSLTWSHYLYLNIDYAWTNIPELFVLKCPHPASMEGQRDGNKGDGDDYFRFFHKREFTGEDVLVQHFCKHPLTPEEIKMGSIMAILAARAKKNMDHKCASIPLQTDDAPNFSLARAIIMTALMGTYVPNKPITGNFIQKLQLRYSSRLFHVNQANQVEPVGEHADWKPNTTMSPGRFWMFVDTFDDAPHVVNAKLGNTIRDEYNAWLKEVFSQDYDRRVRKRLRDILYEHLSATYDTELLLPLDSWHMPQMFDKWVAALRGHIEANKGYSIRLQIHEDYENARDNIANKYWEVPNVPDPWRIFLEDVINENVLQFNSLQISGTSVATKAKMFPLMDPFAPVWPAFRYRPIELLALLGESIMRGGEFVNKADVAAVIWKIALRSRNINATGAATLLKSKRAVLFNDPHSGRNAEITYLDGNKAVGGILADGIKLQTSFVPIYGSNQLEMALVGRSWEDAKLVLPNLSEDNFNAAVSYMRNEASSKQQYGQLAPVNAKRWIEATGLPLLWIDYSEPRQFDNIASIVQKVFMKDAEYKDVMTLSWIEYVYRKRYDTSENNLMVMKKMELDFNVKFKDKYMTRESNNVITVHLQPSNRPYKTLKKPSKLDEEIFGLQMEGASVLFNTVITNPVALTHRPELQSGLLLHEEQKMMGRPLYPNVVYDFKTLLVDGAHDRWNRGKPVHDYVRDIAELAAAVNTIYHAKDDANASTRFAFARRTYFWKSVFGWILYLTPDKRGLEYGFNKDAKRLTNNLRTFYAYCMLGRLNELLTGEALFEYDKIDKAYFVSSKIKTLKGVNESLAKSLDFSASARQWKSAQEFEGETTADKNMADLTLGLLDFVNARVPNRGQIGKIWKYNLSRQMNSVYEILNEIFDTYNPGGRTIKLGHEITEYVYVPDHLEILCDLHLWMVEEKVKMTKNAAEREAEELRKELTKNRAELEAAIELNRQSAEKYAEATKRIKELEDLKKNADDVIIQRQNAIDRLKTRIDTDDRKIANLEKSLEAARQKKDEAAVKEYEEMLAKEKKYVNEMKANLEAMRTDKIKAHEQNTKLQKELDELVRNRDTELHKLRSEAADLRKRNEDLAKRLREAEEKARDTEDLENLKIELAEIQEKLDAATKAKKAADDENERLSRQIKSLEDNKDAVETAVRTKEREIDELKQRIKDENGKVRSLESQIDVARANKDEDAVRNLTAQLQLEKNNAAQLQRDMTRLEAEKVKANKYATDLQESMDVLKERNKKKYERLKKELEETREAKEAAEQKLKEAETKLSESDNTKRQLAENEAEMANIIRAKQEAEDKVEKLTKRVNDVERSKKNAEKNATDKQREIDDLKSQVARETTRVSQLEADVEKARRTNDLDALRVHEASLTAEKNKVTNMQERLKRAEDEKKDLDTSIGELQTSLTSLQNEREKEKKDYQQKLNELEEQNATLKRKLKDLQEGKGGEDDDDEPPSAEVFAHALFSTILYGVRMQSVRDSTTTTNLTTDLVNKVLPPMEKFWKYYKVDRPSQIVVEPNGSVHFTGSQHDPYYHFIKILNFTLNLKWASLDMRLNKDAIAALQAIWDPLRLPWLQLTFQLIKNNMWVRIGDEVDYYSDMLAVDRPHRTIRSVNPAPFDVVQKYMNEDNQMYWGLYARARFPRAETPDELFEQYIQRAKPLPRAMSLCKNTSDFLIDMAEPSLSWTFDDHARVSVLWSKLPWSCLWYDLYRTVMPADYDPDDMDEDVSTNKRKRTDDETTSTDKRNNNNNNSGGGNNKSAYVTMGVAAGIVVAATAVGIYRAGKKRRIG